LFGDRLTTLGYPGDTVEVRHAGASMTFLTIAIFGVVLLCAGLMSLFFNLSISLPANECTGRQRRNSVGPDQDFTAAIGDVLGDAAALGTPSK